MRKLLGIAVVFSSLACAQQVSRTVRIANLSTPQGLQVAATVLRTVCDIRTLSIDTAASSITVTDTPDAVALAEWTLDAIDVGGPMAAQEYHARNGSDDVTRVVYLSNTNTQQGMQELLTQLRTVVSLAKIFNVNEPHAVVFRATAAAVAASNWLIAQLDKPFTPGAAPVSYPFGSEQVRVYYLHNIASPKPTQELLTAIRMQTKAVRVFNSTGPRAIAVRGSSDELAAIDALVAKLDVP